MNNSVTNGDNSLNKDKVFIKPNLPSKCTWSLDKNTPSPHTSRVRVQRPDLLPNILEFIGNTPLVKLNKIPQAEGIKCDVYAKCEFLNPGGSVKDRIGYRMVLDAEEKGILTPGCTIIEPTSGNTGIGIAMASAVKGYRCLIVMPEKMSDEKVNVLKALGAEIIRTPTEAAWDSPESLIMVAHKLNTEIPNSVVLDQYRNPGNPLAHYDGTGNEILRALDNKVDMVVMGTGTGGTMTGVGRRVKEVCPDCILVSADPEGSILAVPEELNDTEVEFYEVEGIGYDFVPTVLDRKIVDRWVKINDKMSLPLARRLIREEGLLCGGSSGAALAAALVAAKDLKEGQRCVVVLPDGVRNYMTKNIFDQWMEARGLQDVPQFDLWWWNLPVSSISALPPKTVSHESLSETALLCLQNQVAVPVLDDNGSILGVLTAKHLLKQQLYSKNKSTSTNARSVMLKKYYKVEPHTSLALVARILEIEPFVVIVEKRVIKDMEIESPIAVIEASDLLKFANTGPKQVSKPYVKAVTSINSSANQFMIR